MRDSEVILKEIKNLLDELGSSLNVKFSDEKLTNHVSKSIDSQKGALGAINILINEKFFEVPREISTVMERMTEIGHYHNRNAVAMNLLNLTRRRILNRLKNKDTKNWEYVLRK